MASNYNQNCYQLTMQPLASWTGTTCCTCPWTVINFTFTQIGQRQSISGKLRLHSKQVI